MSECRYCGRETGEEDPDVLCVECMETFGHTLFSEL